MKKLSGAICLVLVMMTVGYGQESKPKLVVGIIVDQMRMEYLYRFNAKYSEGGFKRLMNDGFMFRNAHYNYVPTYTGPGHASVYTGTTPAIHGIVGNEWYDKQLKIKVNCVNDPKQKAVGTDNGGNVSPWRMLSTTITDELKLATQKRAKVIGMSLKDRGASLPAGHLADGAYWFDNESGRFITSTFYMTSLPSWVGSFNNLGLPDKYLSQVWNTVYPIEQYTESGPDDSPYEEVKKGMTKPVFPYNLPELRKQSDNFALLTQTPFANDLLTEFAKAAIAGEKLGQGKNTDFLCISYSTPDIIGHAVGPNAVEIEDTYIRLDRNMEDLLKVLDNKIGKGNYLLFLTADHAAAEAAQRLVDNNINGGSLNHPEVHSNLAAYLKKYFPDKELIESISNNQVFFNDDLFQSNPKSAGIDFLIASELVSRYLLSIDGVATVYTESVIRQADYNEGGLKGMVARGYNPKRSGNLAFIIEPGWFPYLYPKGTTHGSPYMYDTHVPMLFFGTGIKKGSSVKYHPITDIAPTISVLLEIPFPNGCTGQPIEELFEK